MTVRVGELNNVRSKQIILDLTISFWKKTKFILLYLLKKAWIHLSLYEPTV